MPAALFLTRRHSFCLFLSFQRVSLAKMGSLRVIVLALAMLAIALPSLTRADHSADAEWLQPGQTIAQQHDSTACKRMQN